LGAVALAAVLAGCGAGTDGSDHAGGGANGSTPAVVLSAKAVHGTLVPKDQRHLLSAGCGTDGLNLFGGSSPDNTAFYHRKVDGHPETVIVGAWRWGGSSAKAGLTNLQRAIARDPCPPTTAKRLSGQPTGAFAFSATSQGEHGVRHDVLRSYRYLSNGGLMVMVSLERTDGSMPSAASLADLTRAEVKAVVDKVAADPYWNPPD
jgi:hypothetical protein